MPLIGWSICPPAAIRSYCTDHSFAPIMDDLLHAVFRAAHDRFAHIFFFTILMDVGAALFHALVRRHGDFQIDDNDSPSRTTACRRH